MTSDLDISADLGGLFLKRADVEAAPQRYTVAGVSRETFEARDGKPAQTRIVLTFGGEPARKLGLNKTNLRVCASSWGKLASAWIGRTLLVVWDPTVENRGSVVGGLRIRIPQLAPVSPTPAPLTVDERRRRLEAELAALPPSAAAPLVDDDISFAFGANTGV